MDADKIKAEIAHNEDLIQLYTERFRVLERQSAQFGMYIPAHIQLELETAKKNIEGCKDTIERLRPSPPDGKDELSLMDIVNDYKQLPDEIAARERVDERLEAEAGRIPVNRLQRILDQAPEDREVAMAVAISLGLPHSSDDEDDAARLLVTLLSNQRTRVRYRAAGSMARRGRLAGTSQAAKDIMLDSVINRLKKEPGGEIDEYIRGVLNKTMAALK